MKLSEIRERCPEPWRYGLSLAERDRAHLLAWLDEAREIIEKLKADVRRHGYTTHKADDFLAKLD